MAPTTPEPPRALPTIARRSFLDRSILYVLFAIWLASIGRIVVEASAHRPFGVEATLAVAMAFVVPFVLRSGVRSHRRGR